MAKNIELKIELNEFSDILRKIENKRIPLKTVLHQRDIYYKTEDALLKLRIFSENGELIFYKRDETAKDRVSNYKILRVNPVEAEEMFREIFEIETEVKKKRSLYIYKNTRIHLDEVNELGKFLELETVVRDSTESGKEEFNEVVAILELDISKQIKSSYRTLMLSK